MLHGRMNKATFSVTWKNKKLQHLVSYGRMKNATLMLPVIIKSTEFIITWPTESTTFRFIWKNEKYNF